MFIFSEMEFCNYSKRLIGPTESFRREKHFDSISNRQKSLHNFFRPARKNNIITEEKKFMKQM